MSIKTQEKLKRLLAFTLLSLSATTINAQEPYKQVFIDANNNGLDDRAEGYDNLSYLNSTESRGYGVYELKNALLSASISTASEVFNPELDRDNDGIRDILEVYGFYERYAGTLFGLTRLIEASTWNTWLAGEGEGQFSSPAYQWLAETLTDEGFVSIKTHDDEYEDVIASFDENRIHDIDGWYAIDITLTEALEKIKLRFAEASGHEYVDGTIYPLITELLENFSPLIPSTGQTVYYTDPTEISSDFDPYTDKEEVLGIFPSDPKDGAGHPLIGAIPQIATYLTDIDLIEIVERREQDGTIVNTTDVSRIANSTSSSNGVSIGIGAEYEFGASGGVTLKSEFKYNHTWTSGTTMTTELRESFAVVSNNTDVTQDNCYSQLKMNVKVTNQGSVSASHIEPDWYVYIGGKQWNKITTDNAFSSLSPGESDFDTLLGNEEGCLTIAETNYLANGGTIEIGTGLGDATINYLDPDTNLLVQGGSWSAYEDNFWNSLAKIHLNVITTKGEPIKKSFWVRAYDEEGISPNMTMSVKDVLTQAYSPVDCSTINGDYTDAVICLAVSDLDSDGYIVISEDAQIDFTFFSPDDLSQLAYEQSIEMFEKMNFKRSDSSSDNINYPLDSLLPRYSAISIIDNTLDTPTIQHVEIIATSDSSNNSQGIDVRASVSDYFGIELVELCKRTSNTCETMASALPNQPDITANGYYSITWHDYTLEGDEYIKATNIKGNSTEQDPGTFYLNIIGSMYDKIDSYYSDLSLVQIWIDRYSDKLSGDLGNDIEEHGLIDWQNAYDKYDVLSTLLQIARDTCSYINPVVHDDVDSLLNQQVACQHALNAYEEALHANKAGLYNPEKLPLKNNLIAFNHGVTNTVSYSPNPEASCNKLKAFDVVTGIKLNYDAGVGAAIPGAKLTYRTITRTNLTSPLFKWSDDEGTTTCGNIEDTEQSWSSSSATSDFKINVLVDFGWSVGSGSVTKLCTLYRELDLDDSSVGIPKLSMGDAKDYCSSGSTWDNVERFSNANKYKPSGSSGPVVQSMNNLWLNAKWSSAEATRAQHYSYHYTYFDKPRHSLVHLGEYHFRSHSDLFLTLGNSLSPTLQAESGGDDQIWIVEIVNDREFRIRPKFVDFNADGENDGDHYLARPNLSEDNGDNLFVEEINCEMVIAENGNDVCIEESVNHNQHWRFELRSDGRYDIVSVVNLKYIGSWGGIGVAPFLKTTTLGWDIQPVVNPVPADASNPCPLGSYDGANCYFMAKPSNGFIDDNKFYTTYDACSVGTNDSTHCYINSAPSGTTPFVYADNFYYTPLLGGYCPFGWFDSVNCFVMRKPAGGFISGNSFYTTYDACSIGTGDSTNCYIASAPAGTSAFTYAGNFYTTPVTTTLVNPVVELEEGDPIDIPPEPIWYTPY